MTTVAHAALREIVLARPAWERALRDMLTRPDRFAVGRCRRNPHDETLELLVETLEIVDELPTGKERPPLADWVVLAVPDATRSSQAAAWIKHLWPRPSQLLAILLVGFGPQRSHWDGIVTQDGQSYPLDALRVIGPGMLQARREVTDVVEPFESTDDRWSRTRGALGADVWHKAAESRVMLFGAGRNGSAIAFQLVALGVRSLTIVDPDHVGPENLDASYTILEADVGRPKAMALQERLLAFRSDCAITAIPHSVTHGQVVEQARNVDLIVSCVDNDTPRLAAAMLAHRFLKVHLDVGTAVMTDESAPDRRTLTGDVRLLLPQQGCVCCVGGLSREVDARYELMTPPGALPRRAKPVWHEERAGSLITINALAVSTGLQLWLDLLAGTVRNSQWHRLQWQNGFGLEVNAAAVAALRECEVCQVQT